MRRWVSALAMIVGCVVGGNGAVGQAAVPPDIGERFAAAESAYSTRDYETAHKLYTELATEFPQLVPSHAGLGAVASSLGKYGESIDAYLRAVELRPDEPILMGQLADSYRRNEQNDDAERWYLAAMKAAGGKNELPTWYVGLGLIRADANRFEEAVALYEKARAIDANSPYVNHNLAVALLRLRRYDEADDAYRRALERDPTISAAYYGRGLIAKQRGQLYPARDFIIRASQLDPNEPTYRYALSQIFYRMDKSDEAEASMAAYRAAKAKIYYDKALPHLEANRFKDALTHLQKTVETDPSFARGWYDRAFCQMQLGEYDAAREGLLKAYALDSNLVEAVYHVGTIDAQQGDYDTAETRFREVLARAPNAMKAYRQLAKTREYRGDLSGAGAVYTEGLGVDAEWAPGHWWRGMVREELGKLDAAEADYRRSIEIVPGQPYATHSLARLLMGRGQVEEPFALMETVMRYVTPTHRATLAELLALRGNREAAVREIEQAHKDAPDDKAIAAVRERLLKAE